MISDQLNQVKTLKSIFNFVVFMFTISHLMKELGSTNVLHNMTEVIHQCNSNITRKLECGITLLPLKTTK